MAYQGILRPEISPSPHPFEDFCLVLIIYLLHSPPKLDAKNEQPVDSVKKQLLASQGEGDLPERKLPLFTEESQNSGDPTQSLAKLILRTLLKTPEKIH
ncbi:hypothetical protein ACTXT7_015934, partial [Hymenolepis weldensis]